MENIVTIKMFTFNYLDLNRFSFNDAKMLVSLMLYVLETKTKRKKNHFFLI